jgi:hypothetical protein
MPKNQQRRRGPASSGAQALAAQKEKAMEKSADAAKASSSGDPNLSKDPGDKATSNQTTVDGAAAAEAREGGKPNSNPGVGEGEGGPVPGKPGTSNVTTIDDAAAVEALLGKEPPEPTDESGEATGEKVEPGSGEVDDPEIRGSIDTQDDLANPVGWTATPEEIAAHQGDAGWLAAAEDAAQAQRAYEAHEERVRLAEEEAKAARKAARAEERDHPDDPMVKRYLVSGHRDFVTGYGTFPPGAFVYHHMLDDGSGGIGYGRLSQLGMLVEAGEVRQSEIPAELLKPLPDEVSAGTGSDLTDVLTEEVTKVRKNPLGSYDPGDYNAVDVREFGRNLKSKAKVEALIAAEENGRQRVTVLRELEEHLATLGQAGKK